MESNVNLKLKLPIVFLSGFALLSLVCIALVAVFGLNRAVNDTFFIGDTGEKYYDLSLAQLSYEKTRTLCRDLIIYSEDAERVESIRIGIGDNINNIKASMDTYIQGVMNPEDMEISRSIIQLLEDYYVQLYQLMELGTAVDTAQLEVILQENAPLTAEIANRFQMLSEFNQHMLSESVYNSEYSRNNFVIILILVTIITFIVVLAASITIFYILMKKQNALPEIQNRYTQPIYGSGYTQNDAQTLSELEKCVSELKVVAFDLSQSAKVFKR